MNDNETRVCLHCKQVLPVESFRVIGSGRCNYCKTCESIIPNSEKGRPSNWKEKLLEVLPEGYKRCHNCHKVLKIEGNFTPYDNGKSTYKNCDKCREKRRIREKAKRNNSLSISFESVQKKVDKGRKLAGEAMKRKRRAREKDEREMEAFRKSDAQQTNGRRKYSNVKTPCRMCKRFLSNKCPQLLMALSAGTECPSFLQIQ